MMKGTSLKAGRTGKFLFLINAPGKKHTSKTDYLETAAINLPMSTT